MRNTMMLFLLLLLMGAPLWGQSSAKPESAYTHCFTDTEWAAFEEEVWAEEQATVKEAVEAAVQPHLDYELELKADLAKVQREVRIWKTATWIMLGSTTAITVIVVAIIVIPKVIP